MSIGTTVFVGGGTPTLVPPERLAAVIASIPVCVRTPRSRSSATPTTCTLEMLNTYRSGGVNRVSVGVQSMSAHVLASLGRTHDRDNVARTVAAIRASGMPSFNLDVIYGASRGDASTTGPRPSARSSRFDPPHVSAYGLTVEPGTPLAEQPDRHPDDDDQADKYEIADESFAAAGLANYEVSNWARPGHESRHNFLYWRQHDYRGFGCAAHSHRSGRRWWNVRTPERYIDLVATRGDVEASAEVLDADTRRFERLQLLLRTRDGVPVDSFTAETRALLDGLVVAHPDDPARVVLTRPGG